MVEHFDLAPVGRRHGRHGLSLDWYVYRHRTEDEVLPWDHISAGLHKDFLWQDWQDALAEHGLEDCRWTPCYDCGACTGYGIEHVVASATPPAGGSQGTGQDLSTGGVPVAGDASSRPGRPSRGVRLRIRFTKLGKVRWTSHRDVARMWERAFRRVGLPLACTSGASRPAPRSASGWPSRPAPSRWPSTSTSSWSRRRSDARRPAGA